MAEWAWWYVVQNPCLCKEILETKKIERVIGDL